MDDNYRHCEALVRAADKDRYLAALFAPADKRVPLFALHAFNHEIANIRERAGRSAPVPHRAPDRRHRCQRWWQCQCAFRLG